MFFAYVIKSEVDGSLYKGHCKNLDKGLKEHNSGLTRSTKQKIPFNIIYFEEFNTRLEAINREKYFKSSAGRRYLKRKLVP